MPAQVLGDPAVTAASTTQPSAISFTPVACSVSQNSDTDKAPPVTPVNGWDTAADVSWNKLCMDNSKPRVKTPRGKILILCGGPNGREDSMYALLEAAGFVCHNYDIKNGPEFDLVDNAVWEPLLRSIAAGEYMACIGCPMCATYSKLLNLPGPPVLRDVEGPGRYGRNDLTPAQGEKVRIHTLVSLRVAEAWEFFLIRKLPWLFAAPKASEKEVSVYNLDEYKNLLKQPGVVRTTGVQCPFGARSSKPTDWMHYGMSLDGMPSVCPQPKVTWFNQLDGLAVFGRHRPTSGTATYERSVKAT